MIVDRKTFFDSVRASLFGGSLSTSQVEGMEAILVCWEKTYRTLDQRFIAYSLATALHETAQTMQPIEEYGHGQGHPYGQPVGPWHQVYDGNGLVQLTWLANYQAAQDRLMKLGLIGPEIDIVKNPALARRMDVAVLVLVLGMMEGWFTNKRLAEYFNQHVNDPVGARRIINGTDRANLIAVYYGKFLAAIKLVDNPMPVPAPQITPTPPVPALVPVAPKPQTPLPAPMARPALSLWQWLLAFLKPRPVGNRLIGDFSIMNGMKTYILTTILGTLSAALGATGTLDAKTGIGGVLVAAILFALRHGLSTGIATIIASLAGFVQQALATLRPNEANIAGIVKSAVTEALAEQAAAATATTVATQAAAAAVKTP